VVALVEGLRLGVDGINDDEPVAADFRCIVEAPSAGQV
jgi:hypothetical protein